MSGTGTPRTTQSNLNEQGLYIWNYEEPHIEQKWNTWDNANQPKRKALTQFILCQATSLISVEKQGMTLSYPSELQYNILVQADLLSKQQWSTYQDRKSLHEQKWHTMGNAEPPNWAAVKHLTPCKATQESSIRTLVNTRSYHTEQ